MHEDLKAYKDILKQKNKNELIRIIFQMHHMIVLYEEKERMRKESELPKASDLIESDILNKLESPV